MLASVQFFTRNLDGIKESRSIHCQCVKLAKPLKYHQRKESMNKEKLARLKAERRTLSLRVVERIATKAEKMRLTMIRDEIRRLERYAKVLVE